MDQVASFFGYLRDNGAQILLLTAQHAWLSLLGVVIGVLCAVPLGVFASRRPRAGGVVIDAADMLYTVPSLALLGLLAHHIGFGVLPVLIALSVYSWLPILRNTVAGLRGIDAAVIEAARGMGCTPTQILFRVELPLALPVIMSGIRTVAVLTVSITSMAAFVGAGGLGVLIFQGITMMDNRVTLAGTIPVALLAIGLDQAIGHAERAIRRIVTAV